MRLIRNVFIATILFFTFSNIQAQNVDFKVKAPSPVAVGELFRVEFSLNKLPDSSPEMPQMDGFEIVAGPTVANSVDAYYSGGKLHTTSKSLYTYALIAQKEGVYTIPSVSVQVDGKIYKTKPLPIEVVQETQTGISAGNASGNYGQTTQTSQSSPVGPNDLLLRVITDKSSVYKGQPVRILVKLYYKSVALVEYAPSKSPAFNGFWTQELDARHYEWQRETYNSQIYYTKIVREYLLFPQQSGTLQVDQFDYDVAVRTIVVQQANSLMEELMGGMPLTESYVLKIASPPVKLTVKEWPAGAPMNFKGAVGNFNMVAEFPQEEVRANSSTNVSVKISGNGNLSLIQAPTLNTPSSFEQYNIKTTESLNKAPSGIYGYRQFDYPLIPRAEGEYTIDPVVFTYFNPETSEYVTISSESFQMNVLPDSTGGASVASGTIISGATKEDLKILEEDIRFIKVGNPHLKKRTSMFMCSTTFFVVVCAILTVFAFLLIYLQKRIRELANVEAMRGKRANKVALQRLKAAENYMNAGSRRNFYEEILRALWGYMSDKLNIPVAALTKENVREELLKRNVASSIVSAYTELISDCEYAQYSPGESARLQDVYRKALEVISRLESSIKK